MRRGSKKKPLSQTVEEYASRTSIHGISYIFDRQGQFLKHPMYLNPAQGADPSRSGLLVVCGGYLPPTCHCSHMEQLDTVARNPG